MAVDHALLQIQPNAVGGLEAARAFLIGACMKAHCHLDMVNSLNRRLWDAAEHQPVPRALEVRRHTASAGGCDPMEVPHEGRRCEAPKRVSY